MLQDWYLRYFKENKKVASLKNQIEMFNDEIAMLQAVCSQKEKDFMKADFELKRAFEKIKSLEHDKSVGFLKLFIRNH